MFNYDERKVRSYLKLIKFDEMINQDIDFLSITSFELFLIIYQINDAVDDLKDYLSCYKDEITNKNGYFKRLNYLKEVRRSVMSNEEVRNFFNLYNSFFLNDNNIKRMLQFDRYNKV